MTLRSKVTLRHSGWSLRFRQRSFRSFSHLLYLGRGYVLPMAASGSCWRMARMAVGAVNMEAAPCSDRTRKKAPGSGVPTGLPCRPNTTAELGAT